MTSEARTASDDPRSLRVLVCGSRSWTDFDTIYYRLSSLVRDYPDVVIVEGGAKGADTIARQVAEDFQVDTEEYLPDWEKYKKQAGFKRNIQMLETKPDLVLAFWDGKSKGTRHIITEAKERGIEVEVILGE